MKKDALSDRADFGDLLYRILVREQRHAPSAIADALRVPLRHFNVKLRGLGRFTPEQVALLLHVIPDKRLAGWFLDGSGLLLVNRPMATTEDGASPLEHALICITEAIPAICDLMDALHGSTLGKWRLEAIEAHLDRAQAALLSIKRQLGSPARVENAANCDVPPDGFRHLVRRALIQDRGIRLDGLAAALGLTYAALYLRMSGRSAFRPVELRRMFRMYPDTRCADFLLAGSPYMAIPRPAAGGSAPDADPIKAGLDSLRAIARLLVMLRTGQALRKDVLFRSAEDCLDEALRLLATTRWTMTYIGRARPVADPAALPGSTHPRAA